MSSPFRPRSSSSADRSSRDSRWRLSDVIGRRSLFTTERLDLILANLRTRLIQSDVIIQDGRPETANDFTDLPERTGRPVQSVNE